MSYTVITIKEKLLSQLQRLLNEVDTFLDNDGDTSQISQRMCVLNALIESEKTINAISFHDLKPMIFIGRPVEGISLNGLEYLLDDDGNERLFHTIDNAKHFLSQYGVTEFDGFSFVNSKTNEVM